MTSELRFFLLQSSGWLPAGVPIGVYHDIWNPMARDLAAFWGVSQPDGRFASPIPIVSASGFFLFHPARHPCAWNCPSLTSSKHWQADDFYTPTPHHPQYTEASLLLFTVQSLSCVQLFETQWLAAHQASLSFTISQSLLRFMSTESVMPSSNLILFLPSLFPSISLFQCSRFSKQDFNSTWTKNFQMSKLDL